MIQRVRIGVVVDIHTHSLPWQNIGQVIVTALEFFTSVGLWACCSNLYTVHRETRDGSGTVVTFFGHELTPNDQLDQSRYIQVRNDLNGRDFRLSCIMLYHASCLIPRTASQIPQLENQSRSSSADGSASSDALFLSPSFFVSAVFFNSSTS